MKLLRPLSLACTAHPACKRCACATPFPLTCIGCWCISMCKPAAACCAGRAHKPTVANCTGAAARSRAQGQQLRSRPARAAAAPNHKTPKGTWQATVCVRARVCLCITRVGTHRCNHIRLHTHAHINSHTAYAPASAMASSTSCRSSPSTRDTPA